MTVPNMADIIGSARRKLIASSHFTPLIGVDVGQDPTGGLWQDAWVFKGSDNWETPDRDPSNTGRATVTISARTPWAGPNIYNTARFRRLRFHILADQTRDPNNPRLSVTNDAEYRCDRVAKAIIAEFNDVGNIDHWWPGNTYIAACILYDDLAILDVDNHDGLVSGDLSFALTIG